MGRLPLRAAQREAFPWPNLQTVCLYPFCGRPWS